MHETTRAAAGHEDPELQLPLVFGEAVEDIVLELLPELVVLKPEQFW